MPTAVSISLITLGVADVAAATRFYVRLGFELSSGSVPDEVSFFRTAGTALAVWGVQDLAADAGRSSEPAAGFRATALAMNLASPADVDARLADAEAAGGTVVKAGRPTDWGGYSGYFTDPDGHLWEVAHNPFWPLDDRGLPQLP
jgi:catechol 2,3-dioxygenase-like lactoylglutathione lyase family enzyme